MTKEDLLGKVRNLEETCSELCSKIWDNPEISGEETESANTFRKLFEKEGFKIVNDSSKQTAFYAEYGEGSPVIAIAGEYDALPGLSQKACTHKEAVKEGGPGHGCGHNLLGTGCAMAALALKKYLEIEKISGTVRFYGCPEEEVFKGKALMYKNGMFDGVDFCLAWHPMTSNRVIDINGLATISVDFHFKGVSAHAGFAPDRGRSALDAMELMNVGCNYLREHIPDRSRIHYAPLPEIYVNNIVPASASVRYGVRAVNVAIAKDIIRRVCNVAKGAAMMTETEVTAHVVGGNAEIALNHAFSDLYYKNMLEAEKPEYTDDEKAFAAQIQETLDQNMLAAENRAYGCTDSIFGGVVCPRDHWREHPVNAGSDLGDISQYIPTASFEACTWAMGCSPHTWQAAACSGTSIGAKGALFAAQVLAGAAYDLMNEPETRTAIRKEFEENVPKGYELILERDLEL